MFYENELHFLMDADSSHLCIMLSAKDIDEMKKEELRVVNAAKLDLMTKVLNRETAMESIKNILIQEKDKSIYDGMNQAVTHVTGRYVQFLNCGDLFYDEASPARCAATGQPDRSDRRPTAAGAP